jgi:hypothetical protein
MTLNSGTFTSPTVTMAALALLIEAYDTAQEAMPARTTGLAPARNVKRDNLWTALVSLKTYVQGLVDNLTPDAGIALISAAGMVVSKVGVRVKALLTATLTTTPGMVHLVANELLLVGPNNHKQVTFKWRSSPDGGKTWTNGEPTPVCETDLTGLTLNTEYAFQVAVTVGKTKKMSAWSESVTLLVH